MHDRPRWFLHHGRHPLQPTTSSDKTTTVTLLDRYTVETWRCLNDPPVYFFVSPASNLARELGVVEEGHTYVGTSCTQLR